MLKLTIVYFSLWAIFGGCWLLMEIVTKLEERRKRKWRKKRKNI